VLVIAHGEAIASNMANVANTLLGIEHVHAMDMPLDEKVDVFLNKVIEEVKRLDKGKGVLIMADMGSLTTFSDIITDKTGIETRMLDMVSTPMVIEAARNSLSPEMTIDKLVREIVDLNPYGVKVVGSENLDIKDNTNRYFMRVIIRILSETLTFLNPQKACNVLNEVLHNILAEFRMENDDDITIKFLFHCSCMIERVIIGECLPHKAIDGFDRKLVNIYNIIKKYFKLVEEIFGITIPEGELLYIVDMLSIHCDTLYE
jgi:transcriptional regulatory protein LevR